MPRLLGVEIPADKRVEVSLTYIYGIGFSTARRILEQTNIDPNIRAKDLTPQQLNEIMQIRTRRKRKATLLMTNQPPKRQLQKPKRPSNVLSQKRQQSKRKNNPRLLPERPKLFRSQPKRLTSQRLLRPKEARTFIQALRMCLLRLTTPS